VQSAVCESSAVYDVEINDQRSKVTHDAEVICMG